MSEGEKFLKELREKGTSVKGEVFIKGYTRKDGTKVKPHIRSVKRDKQ